MKSKTGIINLIIDYTLQNVSKTEFMNSMPDDMISNIKLPRELVLTGEEDGISAAVVLMLFQNAVFGLMPEIDLVCELLCTYGHHEHENLAFFSQQIKSPLMADCLYKAAELEFPYLDYDDTYQFARKCIKALYAIGTDKAFEKLERLANSKNEKISLYAKKELNRK